MKRIVSLVMIGLLALVAVADEVIVEKKSPGRRETKTFKVDPKMQIRRRAALSKRRGGGRSSSSLSGGAAPAWGAGLDQIRRMQALHRAQNAEIREREKKLEELDNEIPRAGIVTTNVDEVIEAIRKYPELRKYNRPKIICAGVKRVDFKNKAIVVADLNEEVVKEITEAWKKWQEASGSVGEKSNASSE